MSIEAQEEPLDPQRTINGEGLPAAPTDKPRRGRRIAVVVAAIAAVVVVILILSHHAPSDLPPPAEQAQSSETADDAGSSTANDGGSNMTAASVAAANGADADALTAEHESHDVATSEAQAAAAANPAMLGDGSSSDPLR